LNKISNFTKDDLTELCNLLAARDSDFRQIIHDHGHPPFFSRNPGFAGLIRLILEQQVSLLSAKAAYVKLQAKVTEITPENILSLNDEELRECYFSRQKAGYARILSQAIIDKKLRIKEWGSLPDDEVRKELVQVKGIGIWTADNYLLLCLHRSDIFPIGDVALLNSIKKIKQLPVDTTKEDVLALAEPWRPYRSIAAILLWHAYIIHRRIKMDELEY
jgi:DNA-3-methyladenine glycosylase II